LEYSLRWGGHPWILKLDHDRPGLRRPDLPQGSILALEGVAASGRSHPEALSGKTLIGAELFRSRVEATYAPPGWGKLKVRASWSPTPEGEGLDLEIQVSASSVDELRSVEVVVASRFLDPFQDTAHRYASWVQARDPRSAALSYDGREPARELRHLTTLPMPGPAEPAFEPVITRTPWPEQPGDYLEMVHPQDVARRIILGKGSRKPPAGFGVGVRYGLFGLDLEKGVIVRGRLRGFWVPAGEIAEKSRIAFQEFLNLPPPLGR
jgi:hypothetical protein